MSKKLFRVRRYVTCAGDMYVYASNAREAEAIAGDFECGDFMDDDYETYEEKRSIPESDILNPEDKEKDNE